MRPRPATTAVPLWCGRAGDWTHALPRSHRGPAHDPEGVDVLAPIEDDGVVRSTGRREKEASRHGEYNGTAEFRDGSQEAAPQNASGSTEDLNVSCRSAGAEIIITDKTRERAN